MSKYGNIRTECQEGHKHDSRIEAEYCFFFFHQQKKGIYQKVETQVRFIIVPAFLKHKPRYYIADFVLHHPDGTIEVVDVKGVKTTLFSLKWHLLQYLKLQDSRYIFTILT